MNVIVLMNDTFRRDHMGAYGNDWIHTPNFDHLAEQSAVFDRAYIASYPTIPNRCHAQQQRDRKHVGQCSEQRPAQRSQQDHEQAEVERDGQRHALDEAASEVFREPDVDGHVADGVHVGTRSQRAIFSI